MGHAHAINLRSDYTLSLGEVPRLQLGTDHFVWEDDTANCSAPSGAVGQGARELRLRSCGAADFQLVHAAPEVVCGAERWGLLGEQGKWVPVSEQRFGALVASDGKLTVEVKGSAGEAVAVRFARRTAAGSVAEVHQVACALPPSGRAVASTTGACA